MCFDEESEGRWRRGRHRGADHWRVVLGSPEMKVCRQGHDQAVLLELSV